MVDIPRCLSLRQVARWFDFHVSRSPRRVQLTSVFSQRRREKERKEERSGKQSPREGGSQDHSLDRLAAPYSLALAGVAQCGSRHGTRSQPEASPLLTIFLHYPEKKYLSYKGKANRNEESCQNLPSVPHARRVLCLPRCDGERTGRARQGPARRDGPRRCRHRCDRVKRRRIPGLGRGRRPWRGPGADRGGDLVF